jgi:hypothetical protein
MAALMTTTVLLKLQDKQGAQSSVQHRILALSALQIMLLSTVVAVSIAILVWLLELQACHPMTAFQLVCCLVICQIAQFHHLTRHAFSPISQLHVLTAVLMIMNVSQKLQIRQDVLMFVQSQMQLLLAHWIIPLWFVAKMNVFM